MGTGSFGLQIGAQDTEMILVIRNQGAVDAVLKDQAKFGADAGFTAGIYGVGAEASFVGAGTASKQQPVKKHRIMFKYQAGFSSAVRRPVSISDFF